MQTVPTQFDNLSKGDVRPLSWGFRASFPKDLDPAITFFTLDESLLDGPDVLSPVGTDNILPWDQFDYDNYDERIVSMEWQRERLVPYSVTQAMADITLNNYDGYFTRGSNSPIDQYLLPRRPVRIFAGFNNINIPQFVGLSETVPIVDRTTRQASIHCMDFLTYLFDRSIDSTVMYENLKTDQILDNLLQELGLIPDQYSLDEGFNEVVFFYVEKGQKFGEIVKKLMEAELGSLYMDELGVIVFKNRLSETSGVTKTFNSDNIIDYSIQGEDTIINVVEIKANIRKVQDRQVIFTLSEKPVIMDGTSLFFQFQDPVTSMDDVEFFTANSLEDGSGTDLTSNISVTSFDLFSTSVKVTFANSGADAFLTSLTLYGTPATAETKIYLPITDEPSIAQFEERIMTIENDYIQSNDAANSLALSILNYYKDYANTIELSVQGSYAQQLGDQIHVEIDSINADYRITKIVNILEGARFTQRLTARIYNIPAFFTLDVSILDGPDVLSP